MNTAKARAGLRSLVSALAMLAALASGVAAGQQILNPVFSGPHAEGGFARAAADVHPPAQRRLALDPVPSLDLQRESEGQPSRQGPMKVGFGREVATLCRSTQAAALLDWTPVASARIAALSVTSPDAVGLRLGLLVEKVPARALLRFFALTGGQVFEVTGRAIQDAIDRNLASGDKSDEARTYWSPLIDGQEITLGYAPASTGSRYRLVISANVPSFEAVNDTKDIGAGNLYLAQPQTE
jgi:hypothetical protein